MASANLRRHTSRAVAAWRQFRISSDLRFSSTCLAQRWGGRPCLRQPPGSDSKTTNWVGAIHTSDMTQPSKTLYFNTLHYVDVIGYIVQLLVPSYAPFSSVAERYINLTEDFLSKTPNACSSEDVSVQVSAPYNKTGNMRDLYNQIFVLQEMAFLLNCFLSPK